MNLLDLYAKIVLDDDEYTKGLENAGKKSNSFATALKNGLVNAGKLAAAGIGVASTAITALGKVAFDYNSEVESYVSNFTVMLGDAEAAAKKVDELKALGARTPFEMTDLAKATQTLLAFNVTSDESTGVLERLGDISLGNVSKLESLTRAYGKMNASQKVTLEDINMMIDAGFNPLLIVAENTGETMTELYDRISKGKVSFAEIQNAIDKATSAGGQFYEGMATASRTTEGMISTLKDNVQSLIGEVFTPVTDGITDQILPAAIAGIDNLATAYRERGVAGMAEAAGDMIGASVGELAKNAPQLINSGISLVDNLIDGVTRNQDAIVAGAGDTFFAFVNGISRLAPKLMSTATGLVKSLGSYIVENPDKVIEAGGDLLGNIAIGLAEAIPDLAFTAIEVVASLAEYLFTHAGEVAAGAMEIGSKVLTGIWDGIVAGWKKLEENFSWLTDAINGVMAKNGNWDALPTMQTNSTYQSKTNNKKTSSSTTNVYNITTTAKSITTLTKEAQWNAKREVIRVYE